MKKRILWTAVGVLTAAGAALAASSPLDFLVTLDPTGLIDMETNSLPKGWFNQKNTFTRTKTDIRTTLSAGATDCSPAKGTLNVSSLSDGSFTPILNGNESNAVGYTYDLVRDVSASANHWYQHTHCDGTTEIHGCVAAVPITVTSTAYETSSGACRTYVNDAGQTVCASVSATVSLPAVQDPDVMDTSCGDSCGIGQCVSSCENTCNTNYPGKSGADARRTCKSQCVCTCKMQLPATCGDHPECRD